MKDILFDEKIAGSFHLTPGQAYEEADNGNRSQVHWDMVMMQDANHGGGEIYFDDVLVRKDGLFVLDELAGSTRTGWGESSAGGRGPAAEPEVARRVIARNSAAAASGESEGSFARNASSEARAAAACSAA
jgi:hypothetical protein